ncbi:MAG TPA: hypothetical protein VNZ03_14905 [Terriglobales bacterium]|jgi:hypothetical protein|nr:hypothetical protein [Terriglobales bacterium]
MRVLKGSFDGFYGFLGLACCLQVKSADAVAAKWATRAGAAGADYASGVNGTQKDWATDTAAAAGSWAAGVQTAAANGSFAKGVNAAGTSKWKAKAANVGAARYPQGVAAAKGYYQNGISAVLQVLSGITLPPRGPKGDPSNYNRVTVVGTALRKMKTG